MTLPLPYRPQAVLDLMEEEETAQRRHSLKLVLKKNDLFMDCMTQWYRNMSRKQRSVLTKKKLFRRAIMEAHRLKIPSDSLPEDWVKTLVKECGLVCYISKSALARREFRKATEMVEETEPDGMKKGTGEGPVEVKDSKDFVDLTSEEPPESWTAAREAGNPQRRHLSIASTETSNIIYWDYDLTHWKVEGEGKSLTLNPNKPGPSNPIPYNEWSN